MHGFGKITDRLFIKYIALSSVLLCSGNREITDVFKMKSWNEGKKKKSTNQDKV